MIVFIDNYDSFTFNLVQMFQAAGCEVGVYRNDQISLEQLQALSPAALVISPGPPVQAGICMPAVTLLASRIPILGVCLGHQSIAAAFGGRIVRAGRIMHGKDSWIHHDGKTISYRSKGH